MQAATATLPPKPEPALYRPRKPQLSDLYQLLETHYDDVKAQWEDRFEKAYGTPERNDPQPTKTSSTPPSVKTFADDGPT